MDKILINLRDPSWWFSTFFIAIIVGILAGFLKDKFDRWLAKIFSTLRAKQTLKSQQRKEIIEILLTAVKASLIRPTKSYLPPLLPIAFR